MTSYAPAVPAAAPQPFRVSRAAASAAERPAAPRPDDSTARRREIERAEQRRIHAERVRDNLAARHPLALR